MKRCKFCDKDETPDRPFAFEETCSPECYVAEYLAKHPEHREPLRRVYKALTEAVEVLVNDRDTVAALKGVAIPLDQRAVAYTGALDLLTELGDKEGVQPVWMLC